MVLVQLTSEVRLFYKRGPNAQWTPDPYCATFFETELEASHELFLATEMDSDQYRIVEARELQ